MKLHKIIHIFDHILDFFFHAGMAILLLVWGIVCTDVVMRYVFNNPLAWSVEATEYGLVLIAFLGAGWLLREKGHTQIDIVVVSLAPHTQRHLNTATHLLGAIICLVIAVCSGMAAWDQYTRGVLLANAVEIPKAYLFVVIPLGTSLLSLQFLRNAYETFTNVPQN